MVVSLESQSVRIKPFKRERKKIYNINFNIKLDIKFIPIIISLLLVTGIFSTGTMNLNMEIREKNISYNKYIDLPSHPIGLSAGQNINQGDISLYRTHHLYPGEGLSSIGIKYDIHIDTIINFNKIKNLKDLETREFLLIPKVDGFLHSLEPGDTLEHLATLYSVSKEKIYSANSLRSSSLINLEEIFIPATRESSAVNNSVTKKKFLYPSKGIITKRFGEHLDKDTGLYTSYQGLDYKPQLDINVYATKAGQISSMGYNANYGNYIFIDHSFGFRSLYAHLESSNVEIGQKVKQGEQIAVIGDSGFTSSKKLFFSLLKSNKPVDPERYLF